MKTYRKILVILFVSITVSCASYAQRENYGDNPEKCEQELSTYSEYFKQKNFIDAYPSWSWCFKNCPQGSKNIYIQGTTIIEEFIANEKDPILREKWIDTLILVYDNRIKYFDQKGLVLGRKGLSLAKWHPQDIKRVYDLFKESFDISKIETEYYILEYLMQYSIVLYTQDALKKEDVLNNYSAVSEILKQQIAMQDDATKKAKIEESAQNVENLFVNSGVADCDVVIKMYTPKYEENPTNLELAKKIIQLLDMGSSDECKANELYSKVAIIVYENDKTATAAHSLAQSFFKKKDAASAEKYYLEAISLETDPLKKANMYYELALVYNTFLNNYQGARDLARKALANDPNYGKAYILIGKIYAATARNFVGDTKFEKAAVNCLIVDQFIKAKSLDNSANVVNEANQYISRYSAGFPKQEDAFWHTTEVKTGDPFTVGGWIQETTTIRFSD